MIKLLFSLFLVLTFFTSQAQYDSTDYRLLEKAYLLQSEYKRDSAIIFFEKAGLAFKEKENWKKYIECLCGENRNFLRTDRLGDVEAKGKEALKIIDAGDADEIDEYVIEVLSHLSRYYWYAKGNFPEALKHLDRAIIICDQIDIDIEKRRIQLFTEYGYTYGYSGDFEGSVEYFKKALDLALIEYGSEHEVVADRYTDMVFPLIQKSEWEKAEVALKEAIVLNIKLRGPDHMAVLKNYNNLGYVYLEKFDNDLAILYLNKAISMIKEKFGENHRSVGIGYMNLGASYSNKGEYRRGIIYSEKAIENFKVSIGEQSPYLGLCLLNLGNEYNHLEIFDSAEYYYEKALQLRLDLYGSDHHEVVNTYGYLSDFYIKTGRYDEALDVASKARDIASRILPVKHKHSANNHLFLSQYYTAVGNYEKSLQEAQLAIIGLVPDFNDSSITSNPTFSQDIISTRILIDILMFKTRTLTDYYGETNDSKYLKMAAQTAEVTDQTLDILRIEYQTPESKEILLTRSKEFFENAIDVSFQIYEQTGDLKNLDLAFNYFEKSKSILLYENVKSNTEFASKSLPDSLAIEEKSLSRSIAFYTEQLMEVKANGDSAQLAHMENEFFSKKRDYDFLLNHIEENYPDYYSIQYSSFKPSLQSTQSGLDAKTAIIEYFFGKHNIYALLITRKMLKPAKIAIDPKLENELRQVITGFGQKEFKAGASNEIYNKILAELVESSEMKKVSRLTFIPDGILHYLPFEILVSSNQSSASVNYLIHDYTISYLHSATLPEIYSGKNKTASSYLGFSPAYNVDSNPLLASRSARDTEIGGLLSKLPRAEMEIQTSAAIWKGDSYTNEKATEQNFKLYAKDAAIIHIASHAVIDDEDPMNSKLVFSPGADTIEDGLLHTFELYNMELNAKLACLSACNTGFGQLKGGEGVVSLAKGFFYAGVPNVMMSLWSVPDQSTSEIMTEFYKELKKGAGKADALRNAKLTYLMSADKNTSDPYYWGAITLVGDNQAMKNSNGLPLGIAGGLFLLIFAGGAFYKRNSNSA